MKFGSILWSLLPAGALGGKQYEAIQGGQNAARPASRRIPLTIAPDPQNHALDARHRRLINPELLMGRVRHSRQGVSQMLQRGMRSRQGAVLPNRIEQAILRQCDHVPRDLRGVSVDGEKHVLQD